MELIVGIIVKGKISVVTDNLFQAQYWSDDVIKN